MVAYGAKDAYASRLLYDELNKLQKHLSSDGLAHWEPSLTTSTRTTRPPAPHGPNCPTIVRNSLLQTQLNPSSSSSASNPCGSDSIETASGSLPAHVGGVGEGCSGTRGERVELEEEELTIHSSGG